MATCIIIIMDIIKSRRRHPFVCRLHCKYHGRRRSTRGREEGEIERDGGRVLKRGGRVRREGMSEGIAKGWIEGGR